ncbi:sensor domain-containing protein [Microbacterium mitrae]|nr:sensor domain-containing protein [Microbacterium mitrae]
MTDEGRTQWPAEFRPFARPFRPVAYAATGMIWGLPFANVWLALILLPLVPVLGIFVSAVERRRVAILGMPTIPSSHIPIPREERRRWLSIRLREPITWREAVLTLMASAMGFATGALVAFGVPLGFVFLLAPGFESSDGSGAIIMVPVILVAMVYGCACVTWAQYTLTRKIFAPFIPSPPEIPRPPRY